MRVLILTPDIYTRGGIARYTSTLASAMADLVGPDNVHVLPLLSTPGAKENCPACHIFNPVTVRLSTASKFRFAFRALSLGLRKYDLVVSTHIGLSPVAAMMRVLFRTPFWVTCHGSEAWARFPIDVRWALKRARLVLPVSRFTANTISRVNGIPQSKMTVIYNAIPDEFAERLISPGGVGGHGAASDRKDKTILSVGTVSRESAYKGYDTVIKALPQVLQVVPSARYVVVGEGDDIDRLKGLAREVGVGSRVDFKGGISDAELARCYRDCNVFALPSRTVSLNGNGWQGEGFGRVYVEASLAGKPVVGSTGGGAAEAVLHRKTGLLVNPEYVAEVTDALVYLLQNLEKAAMMGREGRSWARKTFSEASLRSSLATVLDGGGYLQ